MSGPNCAWVQANSESVCAPLAHCRVPALYTDARSGDRQEPAEGVNHGVPSSVRDLLPAVGSPRIPAAMCKDVFTQCASTGTAACRNGDRWRALVTAAQPRDVSREE